MTSARRRAESRLEAADSGLAVEGFDEPARPSDAARWSARLRGLAADLTPIRTSPEFRRLWIGGTVSFAGTQMTAVAVPIQVYAVSHSTLLVGLASLVSLLPLVAFGLVGGAIADRVDRRRLVVGTSSVLALLSGLLCVQAAAGTASVAVLFVLVAVAAAFGAIDSPARQTFPPRLLPSELIPAATALGQLGTNSAMTAGPLVAGVLIGSLGLPWAYGFDALSFLVATYAVLRLPPMPPLTPEADDVRSSARPGPAPRPLALRALLASVVQGFAYLAGNRVVLMTFVVDLIAMVFGMPRALFPAIAGAWYHGGAQVVGLLYAAPAIGGVLVAIAGGWLGRVRRQGAAVLLAITSWGVAVTAFGLTRVLWVGVLLLALAGASDMVSAVFRSTILQVATPDAMRGRLSGVFIVVVAGGPRLGDLESGGVAALGGLAFSVVSGGIACLVALAAAAALVPAFARYDASARRVGASEAAL